LIADINRLGSNKPKKNETGLEAVAFGAVAPEQRGAEMQKNGCQLAVYTSLQELQLDTMIGKSLPSDMQKTDSASNAPAGTYNGALEYQIFATDKLIKKAKLRENEVGDLDSIVGALMKRVADEVRKQANTQNLAGTH
jgi:hypothetical protein